MCKHSIVYYEQKNSSIIEGFFFSSLLTNILQLFTEAFLEPESEFTWFYMKFPIIMTQNSNFCHLFVKQFFRFSAVTFLRVFLGPQSGLFGFWTSGLFLLFAVTIMQSEKPGSRLSSARVHKRRAEWKRICRQWWKPKQFLILVSVLVSNYFGFGFGSGFGSGFGFGFNLFWF